MTPRACTPSVCTHGGRLCDPCTDRLLDRLRQLPELWVSLTLQLAHGATRDPTTGHVAGTREPPCPLGLDVYDHLVKIRRVTATFAAIIAAQRRLTPPRTTPAFHLHITHAVWSASRPWSHQYSEAVHGLWKPAMDLTHSWPEKPQHAPGVPCPTCGRQALHRTPGSDRFKCAPQAGGCGANLSMKATATTSITAHAAEAQ